jgi:hypothetical protein
MPPLRARTGKTFHPNFYFIFHWFLSAARAHLGMWGRSLIGANGESRFGAGTFRRAVENERKEK